MESVTIWVSNLILVEVQFTHEIFFHHFKTLSLCFQGIAGEFTNSEELTINIYACLLCGRLTLQVPLQKFSFLSLFNLIFSFQCYCSPLSWIPAFDHPKLSSSSKMKEDIMQSIIHEIWWTMKYKLKQTINNLYDI